MAVKSIRELHCLTRSDKGYSTAAARNQMLDGESSPCDVVY